MREITFSILRILSDGLIHSGTVLAQALGCSRATISNALQDTEFYGVEIAKIRGCGYRWINPIRWLDEISLHKYLGNDSSFFSLKLCDTIPSTNTYLLNSFNSLLATNRLIQVVAAELQTNGRGRRGSRWQTGLGDSLTLSLLWKFDQGSSSLSGLSLVIGIAIIRVFKQFAINTARLKWPNDVLYDKYKLAGTLIELRGEMLGPTYAVIGIGINFNLSSKIKLSIDQPAGDLYQITGCNFDRNIVFATLLSELRHMLIKFSQFGFAFFRNEWVGYHAYEGQLVKLTFPNKSIIEGIVDNVNEDGSLNLVTSSGRRSFSVGDISLRLRT
jgi:BirA family transcriptional regulator, biotin operon repressor / biotin---[acetyl-CoA-carboxylase] ligase